MQLTRLSLLNFRNYQTVDLTLTSGTTLFLGPNGQGKTNLIEAINFISSLSSHRTHLTEALIKQGEDQAIIRLSSLNEERELQLDFQFNRKSPNRAQINKKATAARELRQNFHSVLFAPEDLTLIRGEPGLRRRFLDEALVKLYPKYSGIIQDYEKTLKQRNTLLKLAQQNKRAPDSTIELWNDQLISKGSEIIFGRIKLIQQLQPLLVRNYQTLVETDHQATLWYLSSVLLSQQSQIQDLASGAIPLSEFPKFESTLSEIQTQFRFKLEQNQSKEVFRGTSLYGPHRDELFLGLNNLPVKGFASHGESWSFALALKLSYAELLREVFTQSDPVLLLDDVFAELDSGRRSRLAKELQKFEQVIISAAVAEDVPVELKPKIFKVRAGKIEEPEKGVEQ